MKKYWWLLLIPIAIIAADQAFKYYIDATMGVFESKPLINGIVRLTYLHNTGAAFGFLKNARWFFIVLSIPALVVSAWMAVKGKIKNLFGLVSYACIFGGATGNLVDRIWLGYVRDMFEFEFVRFGIFNIADIFISCGGVALCVYLVFMHEKLVKQEANA